MDYYLIVIGIGFEGSNFFTLQIYLISELFNTHFPLEFLYTLTELFFKGNLKHKCHFHRDFDLGKYVLSVTEGAVCTFKVASVEGAACHFSVCPLPLLSAPTRATSIRYVRRALCFFTFQ